MKRIFQLNLILILLFASVAFSQAQVTIGNNSGTIILGEEGASGDVNEASTAVENVYMLSVHLASAINPGIAFNGEWALDHEWVISAEVVGGYNFLAAMNGISDSFYIQDEVSARWYWNRERRALKGRSIRKNSGAFLEVGLAHIFTNVNSNYPSYDYGIRRERDMLYGNGLYGFVAVGSKMVSKSHIYFSWKVGLGYGGAFTHYRNKGITESAASIFPECNIKVGYAF